MKSPPHEQRGHDDESDIRCNYSTAFTGLEKRGPRREMLFNSTIGEGKRNNQLKFTHVGTGRIHGRTEGVGE
jgi:hypothetical protein